MDLFSCKTRPWHPFHAAYRWKKVDTFLLLDVDLHSALQVPCPLIGFSCKKKSLPQRNVRADKSIFLGECSEAECWTNDCVLLTETDAYVCSFCQGVWAFPILFVTAKLPLMRIKFSWKIISHELSGAVFLARFVNSLFPKTESLVKINSESLQF